MSDSPIDKIRDGFFEHLGSTAVVVLTGLIGWLIKEAAPALLPVVEASIPIRVLIAILLLSLLLNIGLIVAVWRLSPRQTKLRLKYGVLSDQEKNPHCPVCKNAGLDFNDWSFSGTGFLCKSCNKVYALKDSAGNEIEIAHALASL